MCSNLLELAVASFGLEAARRSFVLEAKGSNPLRLARPERMRHR